MTLYEFRALDSLEQAEAVWNGMYLDDRIEGDLTVVLYQIDAFYVEVFYHQDMNRVIRYRPFATTDLLTPYLNKIDLHSLFN